MFSRLTYVVAYISTYLFSFRQNLAMSQSSCLSLLSGWDSSNTQHAQLLGQACSWSWELKLARCVASACGWQHNRPMLLQLGHQYSIAFYDWATFHCVDKPHCGFSIHQFVDIWIVSIFWLLRIATATCTSFVWIYVFHSLGDLPRNGISGSCDKSMFNVSRPFSFPKHFTLKSQSV